jgi:hypothetical protein
MVKIKIEDLVEAFELQSDGMTYYVNVETGEVTFVTDEDLSLIEDKLDWDEMPEWHQTALREAEAVIEGAGTTYLVLPSEHDLNEYGMMREFIDDLTNPVAAEDLAGAIRGKNAFRRFKDGILHWGIEKDWYRFREESYAKAAIAWCEENDLAYEAV